MTLHWHAENLERHTAKHFLGNPGEDWRGLCPEPSAWDAWRRRADAARCNYDEHPSACQSGEACRATQAEAAVSYRQLVDEDWSFAERWQLLVIWEENNGQRACGTGPHGIFIPVIRHRTGVPTAKSGYRSQVRARVGPRAVLGAVRSLKAHASTAHGGRTVAELIQLETRLLLGRPGGDTPLDALAAALRGAS